MQPVRQRGTRTHIVVFRLVTIQRERGVASGLTRESGTLTWESRRVKRELDYIAFPMGNFSFDCLLDRAVTRGNGLLGCQWRPFYCARTLEEPLGVLCLAQDL